MLWDLFQWWGRSPVGTAINNSEWLFPVVESIHICGLALLIGTIAIVDLRLLGLGLRQPVSQLARELHYWTRTGIITMLLTGPILLSSEPRYYFNPSFRFKMTCLLLAIVSHFTIHRSVTRSDRITPLSRLSACLSLTLWIGVVLGGRGIPYFF